MSAIAPRTMKQSGLLGNEVAGVNQILPIIYPWAWDLYTKGVANNWVPTEVPMNTDIEQWKGGALSEDERLLVKRCMGFFAGSESLVANNLLLSAMRWITNPECRQYIGRQNYEELLHNHTVVYVCDSLGLDINEIYEAYQNIPSIKAKDDFLMSITSDISRPDFTIATLEGKQELVRNFITYWIICEGIMFYSGFAMLLNFRQRNLMKGIGEQIEYTLRDESLHIEFGTNIINTLREEHPEVFTEAFIAEICGHVEKAVELEIQYAYDVLPNGILGLTAPMFMDYVRFIANRRMESLNFPLRYENVANPFAWMSEAIDLEKQKNFFESRVTSYSVGTLEDDF